MGMDLALGFERLVGDPAYLKSKASSVKGISRQGSASQRYNIKSYFSEGRQNFKGKDFVKLPSGVLTPNETNLIN